MLEREQQLHAQGYALVAGVDEAGRGPLAGPVFAAAVILDEKDVIPQIRDSKKITEKKREELYDYIVEHARAYAVCCVDEKEIDRINILRATHKAMYEAVKKLSVQPDFVLIDGNSIGDMDVPHACVVKGDATVSCIAAASILAKVSRDRFVRAYEEQYPQYGFSQHKGYGTKAHIAAIREYGLCPVHRRSFTKKFVSSLGEER